MFSCVLLTCCGTSWELFRCLMHHFLLCTRLHSWTTSPMMQHCHRTPRMHFERSVGKEPMMHHGRYSAAREEAHKGKWGQEIFKLQLPWGMAATQAVKINVDLTWNEIFCFSFCKENVIFFSQFVFHFYVCDEKLNFCTEKKNLPSNSKIDSGWKSSANRSVHTLWINNWSNFSIGQ